MSVYMHDFSLLDFGGFGDTLLDPVAQHNRLLRRSSSSSDYSNSLYDDAVYHSNYRGKSAQPKSPPRHRHDGTSPLPLGMDWSLPPRKWDGWDSVWPHDSHTGWSFCVTIPSWTLMSEPRGSDPVAFYRVQVGIQSPEGITTTRGILRRYSEFLNLLSELKKVFPQKTLPPAPPKKILKRTNKVLLEERRCSLEEWMEKLLSDIDVSRSATIGTFLELEAAVRSYFDDTNPQVSDANSLAGDIIPSSLAHTDSDISLLPGSMPVAAHHGNGSPEMSEFGTPRHVKDYTLDPGLETSTSGHNISNQTGDGIEPLPQVEYQRLDGHVRRLSSESSVSDFSSIKASEISNLGVGNLFSGDSVGLPEGASETSNLKFPRNLIVALPSDQRTKLNRVLNTAQQRIATAKTDMEDLIARYNQEVAVRQFLTTKVKDLEVDLETTRASCKENIQQAVLSEKERFTQMQWDVEDLRRQYLEMELKLKSEQDERAHAESEKISIIKENEMLARQLDVAKEELQNLHKHHEELEMTSKADLKLLVKEVKSLRSSHSDLKQELSRLMKEKLELERVVQKEKQRTQLVTTANTKLLRECEILRSRLQECSVNFLVEEEDRLIVDTSTPSDAIDLLTTSDNRIGLLLAGAQLLAQDVETSAEGSDETIDVNGGDKTGNELRKLVTEVFIDNARLRMQINSLIRCTLNTHVNSDKEDEEDEVPLRKTVLSKFLER